VKPSVASESIGNILVPLHVVEGGGVAVVLSLYKVHTLSCLNHKPVPHSTTLVSKSHINAFSHIPRASSFLQPYIIIIIIIKEEEGEPASYIRVTHVTDRFHKVISMVLLSWYEYPFRLMINVYWNFIPVYSELYKKRNWFICGNLIVPYPSIVVREWNTVLFVLGICPIKGNVVKRTVTPLRSIWCLLLSSALDGVEWSALSFDRFTLWERIRFNALKTKCICFI
jgi:hypothetical protein